MAKPEGKVEKPKVLGPRLTGHWEEADPHSLIPTIHVAELTVNNEGW